MRIIKRNNKYMVVKGYWFWAVILKVLPGEVEAKNWIKKHENKI